MRRGGETGMFMNEYSHTIDAKGRMILPAKFREELGENFILSPGIDTCLTIYPRERWEMLLARIQQLSATKLNVRQFRRFLIGGSTEMECDRQGRILIPAHLRARAKLEKDAKIIGVGDTIEVWNPALLNELQAKESMADIAESLDIPLGFNM